MWGQYLIGGLVAGVVVFLVLWVSDVFGSLWAGIVASLPVTFLIILYFMNYDKLQSFIYFFAWGKFAYMIMLMVAYSLIVYYQLGRVELAFISISVWLFIIGVIYCGLDSHYVI